MSMTNRKPMVTARENRRFNQETRGASYRTKAYRYRYIDNNGKEHLDVVVLKGGKAKVKATLKAQLESHDFKLTLFEARD